jgi:hypothetical protein
MQFPKMFDLEILLDCGHPIFIKLSEIKSNIYAFSIFIINLISDLKSSDLSPRTGMLKFAKGNHSKSLADIIARLSEERDSEDSSKSRISDPDEITSSDNSSKSSPRTSPRNRPKTPLIDRRIARAKSDLGKYSKNRHSMCDDRKTYQFEVGDFGFPKNCKIQPIKMQIIWNGIVV